MNEPNKEPKPPKVKTTWQSGWCSVGGGEKFQARVGKSSEGFHAGIAKWDGKKTTMDWGPATPDEKLAKSLAQIGTSLCLGKKSAAQEFGSRNVPQIQPAARGRAR
jgi:hypothetical protein